MPSSKLDTIWMQALEQSANPARNTDLPLLRVKYPSESSAEWGRNQLYKLRMLYRQRSKKGLDPQDPAYDTSPFDRMKLILVSNYLEVWEENHSPVDFEIELPEGLLENLPRKYAHRKSSPTAKKSSKKRSKAP